MSKSYIQLGKNGDLLNLLPLLHHDSQQGEKPKVMVAAEFAGLLDGVSYVEPVIYQGPHYEIGKAVKQAKAINGEWVCAQVNGPVEQVAEFAYGPAGMDRAVTTSYQKEMWRILGRLKEWDETYPLVFDRRDKDREAKVVQDVLYPPTPKKGGRPPKPKKLMLVSTAGQSSPFPFRDLLLELLTLKFKAEYNIIVLDELRLFRFYDLLGLYEKADMLVATDSAPLHLARAVPTLPTVALVNDKPQLWNGSPWRPNHIFYCRYSDWPTRAKEMLDLLAHFQPQIAKKYVCVWNEYDSSERRCDWGAIAIRKGMCGRDSENTIQDEKRMPYLKDCIRMGLQRAEDSQHLIIHRRDTLWSNFDEVLRTDASYAYRFNRKGNEDTNTFSPWVDMFCARKSWWKTHLDEIPDLIWGNDAFWGQTLLAIFKQHGADDVTGAIFRIQPPNAGQRQPDSKRVLHNSKLHQETLTKLRVTCRFPKVSDQHELLPINQESLFRFGYNPSIIERDGKLTMVYRFPSGQDTLATALGIAELDWSGAVLSNNVLIPPSVGTVDDPRLFSLFGNVMVCWLDSTWPLMPVTSIVKYGILRDGMIGGQCEIAPPNPKPIEKNHVPFPMDGKLRFIYQSAPEQVIYEVQSGKVIDTIIAPTWRWPYGEPRGGTAPLPFGDKLLRFFHSSLDNEWGPNCRRYFIGACLMEAQPPYAVTNVSRKPILYGSEIDDYKLSVRREAVQWKDKVVFPCGAIQRGDEFWLSVGVNDAACQIVRLREKNLNL